ncbi:MAG: glycosyltransferase family 2 protein [Candidatus Omnitrophica bacterium]|nr:glycosyltransferase family 2 protein [Candidatus Omnitrophota bacterium]
MPVRNEANFIRQTFDSLLAQDYSNFEVIVYDNASDDGTDAICLEYARRDARIHYLRNETNLGSGVSFHQVLLSARGKYFMWIAGHDLLHPSFLSRAVALLEDNPNVVLCYPKAQAIDIHGRELHRLKAIDTLGLPPKKRFPKICRHRNWYIIYGLMRLETLEEINDWTLDSILISQLCLKGEFALLPEVMLYLRAFPQKSYFATLEEQLLKINPGKNDSWFSRNLTQRFHYHYTFYLILKKLYCASLAGKDKFELLIFSLLAGIVCWYKELISEICFWWLPRKFWMRMTEKWFQLRHKRR